jgi:uncharacterized protein YndB with AHSA1/START domain
MPTRLHSIRIARPPSAVFAAIADVTTHHRWQAGLVRSEPDGNSHTVGARGAEIRRFFGREVRFPYEITVYEAPGRWGFRALGGPVRPEAVLALEVRDDGTCVTSRLTVPGLLGWLVIGAMLRQQRKNYRTLKQLLETGSL